MSTYINQLSSIDAFQGSDLFAIWQSNNSDTRKGSLSLLMDYINANIATPATTAKAEFKSQYATPSATGFNVPINDTKDNTWLILTPTTGFAAGTITLPAVANAIDAQEVLVNCTQQITTLTVDGNGATAVTGEPASMGADDFFRMKFDIFTKTWYRVG